MKDFLKYINHHAPPETIFMITIVVSTNRVNSLSKAVAIYYQSILAQKNIESQLLDLAQLPVDFAFSALYQNNGKNPAFNKFQQVIAQSEKFVFIVPEYNGSFPGVLKTFIDGLQFPASFKDKKCALVGISSGVQGGAVALSHFSDILNYLGMHVLALRLKLGNIEDHWNHDHITNDVYNTFILQQIDEFVRF